MDEAERYRRALSYARGLDIDRLAGLIDALGAILAERRAAPDPDELLTLVEAARVAGLALATLNTQRLRGKLACQKRGRDWYVTRGELDRYLASRDTHRGSLARRLAGNDSTKGE
jgi:Helix-turn-helix domain